MAKFQRDDAGRSMEQPVGHGTSHLKTDKVAVLARQLHGTTINGYSPTISNNSMRFDIPLGGLPNPFSVSFDPDEGVDGVFTITYSFPVYIREQTATTTPWPLGVTATQIESGTGSVIHRQFKFNKPGAIARIRIVTGKQ